MYWDYGHPRQPAQLATENRKEPLMTDVLSAPSTDGIATVTPLSVHVGAEIAGIDISRPLSPEAFRLIDETLLRRKVVFFRGQTVDHRAQIAFGRQFGELTYAHPHDDTPPDGYPEIYTVDPRRLNRQYGIDEEEAKRLRKYSYTNGWHTDVTPAVNPPAGSILRADVVPPYGGDTTFTNLVAAYEALAEPVQGLLDQLRAEHFYGAGTSQLARTGSWSAKFDQKRLVAHHPVVRVHPRTGEKALFVNPVFTDHIPAPGHADRRGPGGARRTRVGPGRRCAVPLRPCLHRLRHHPAGKSAVSGHPRRQKRVGLE
jgi:taurine dioxygenase